MIYNATISFDVQRAKTRLNSLIEKGKTFEIKEKKKTRSLPQNRYLHLILSWYAYEYGETMEYVKQEVFKKVVNREVFLKEYINKKTGEIREDWKSTRDLNALELTTAIERFRDYSSKEAGIYLPEPRDLVSLEEIEKQISNQQVKQYL